MRDTKHWFYSKNKKKMNFFTLLVNKECTSEITLPSNSVPASVLMVMGEKERQKMCSQTLEAMKREIPWPMP